MSPMTDKKEKDPLDVIELALRRIRDAELDKEVQDLTILRFCRQFSAEIAFIRRGAP